jgi:hypothetical protein
MSLLSMFLPSNPFTCSFSLRNDTDEKRKSHSLDFFKSPMYTIVRRPHPPSFFSTVNFSHSRQFASVLVIGAISVPGTLEQSSFNRFVSLCFWHVVCAMPLMSLPPLSEQIICGVV